MGSAYIFCTIVPKTADKKNKTPNPTNPNPQYVKTVISVFLSIPSLPTNVISLAYIPCMTPTKAFHNPT